jgi:hypothetical protein
MSAPIFETTGNAPKNSTSNRNSLFHNKMRFLQVFGWIFLLITSLLASAAGFIGLVSFESVPGPVGPGTGGAILILLGLLAGGAVGVIISIRSKPDAKLLSPRVLFTALGAYALAALIMWKTLDGGGKYLLSFRVVDQKNNPVANAQVRFSGYYNSGGIGRFDHVARGSTNTDSEGELKIRANHGHTLNFDIRKEGFEDGQVSLEGAGKKWAHQLILYQGQIIPTAQAFPTSTNGDSEIRTFRLSPTGDINLTIVLKPEAAAKRPK